MPTTTRVYIRKHESDVNIKQSPKINDWCDMYRNILL